MIWEFKWSKTTSLALSFILKHLKRILTKLFPAKMKFCSFASNVCFGFDRVITNVNINCWCYAKRRFRTLFGYKQTPNSMSVVMEKSAVEDNPKQLFRRL